MDSGFEKTRSPSLAAVALAALLALGGCRSETEDTGGDPDVSEVLPQSRLLLVRKDRRVALPRVMFRDVTKEAGIDFRHINGAFGKKLLPETMGSGVVVLDYDNDGRQDLFFINSCYWPGHEPAGQPQPTCALYRNLGGNRFQDVSEETQLNVTLYGMGGAAGDFDNDGWIDLFVTAVGGNRLFRNVANGKGGRKFADVTRESPDLAPNGSLTTEGEFLERESPIDFPSSATFVDYDNDGYLDLFVCNYVIWSPKYDLAQGYTLKGTDRAYNPPKAFKGTFCQLFRNTGPAGKFRFLDVSQRAGVQVSGALPGDRVGKSLGVIACDPNKDGYPDLIVANDTVRNFFFLNKGDGTFEECGQHCGVAYATGTPRGAMGIDYGQYRKDRFGVAIGNFANEPNTLLRLDVPEKTLFSDVAPIEGVGGPSRPMLVFGLFWFDYDLDGRLDLLTCNGHIEPDIQLAQPGQRYKQPVQLFWNTGKRKGFEVVTPYEAGEDLFKPIVGRGAAYADFDGDGDLDIVLTENNGPARLLINQGGTGHHWVRLRLEGDGKRCNRSAIGTRVVVITADAKMERSIAGARGYLSQPELPLTFGLGGRTKIERIEVYWPNRPDRPQVLRDLEIDREYHIRQTDT